MQLLLALLLSLDLTGETCGNTCARICPEKGPCYVASSDGIFEDYCVMRTNLIQNICLYGKPSTQLVHCNNGCYDGRCVDK